MNFSKSENSKQKKATATSDSPIIVKCSHSNKMQESRRIFPKTI